MISIKNECIFYRIYVKSQAHAKTGIINPTHEGRLQFFEKGFLANAAISRKEYHERHSYKTKTLPVRGTLPIHEGRSIIFATRV